MGSSKSSAPTVKPSQNFDVIGKIGDAAGFGAAATSDQCGGPLKFSFDALIAAKPGLPVHIDATDPGLVVSAAGPIGRLSDPDSRHVRGCVAAGFKYTGTVVGLAPNSNECTVELLGIR